MAGTKNQLGIKAQKSSVEKIIKQLDKEKSKPVMVDLQKKRSKPFIEEEKSGDWRNHAMGSSKKFSINEALIDEEHNHHSLIKLSST